MSALTATQKHSILHNNTVAGNDGLVYTLDHTTGMLTNEATGNTLNATTGEVIPAAPTGAYTAHTGSGYNASDSSNEPSVFSDTTTDTVSSARPLQVGGIGNAGGLSTTTSGKYITNSNGDALMGSTAEPAKLLNESDVGMLMANDSTAIKAINAQIRANTGATSLNAGGKLSGLWDGIEVTPDKAGQGLANQYSLDKASVWGSNGLYWDAKANQFMDKEWLGGNRDVNINELTFKQANQQQLAQGGKAYTAEEFSELGGGKDVGTGSLTGMEAAQVGLGLAGLVATIDNNKFNQRMARKNYGLARDQFDVAKADIGYKDDGTTNRSRTQDSLSKALA